MGIGSGQSLERTQALDFGTILAQALKKFIGIFTLREWLVTHTQTLPVLVEARSCPTPHAGIKQALQHPFPHQG